MWVSKKKYQKLEFDLKYYEESHRRLSKNHSATKMRLARLMDYLKLRIEKVEEHEKIVKTTKGKYGC